MSAFVDLEAEAEGGLDGSDSDRSPVGRGRGGQRRGAGRPRGSGARNPTGDRELNKQGKYWHITINYNTPEEEVCFFI